MSAEFLEQLAQALQHDVLTDPADCYPYGSDNSRLHRPAMAVAFPATEHEVVKVVQLCRHHRIPLTARGRGTATTGASVPLAHGVVVSFERMQELLAFDPDSGYIKVQPGVSNRAVQDRCAEHGLFWPPDPGSADYCTVGGNLACNAAGPRAIKYGTSRENTLGLRAVSGHAEVLVTGAQTSKSVVGLDLTRLLIGSEGTLALITEATLKLLPQPPACTSIRLGYRSVNAASQAVSAIMRQPVTPCALELIDDSCLQLIRSYQPLDDLPDAVHALLLLKVDGHPANLAADSAAIIKAAPRPGRLSVDRSSDPAQAQSLWKARKVLSQSLRLLKSGKINEDVAVPISQLSTLIDNIKKSGHRHGLIIACFGHAGNGNLHVNVLYDTESPQQQQRAEHCVHDIFQAVLQLGGTLSGEHGVGLSKRDFVSLEIPPPSLAMMRAIKNLFDPQHILNPDKGLPLE